MISKLKTKKFEWISGLAGLFLGSAAAFVEAWYLGKLLTDNYPFKIMSTPPPEYYVDLATKIGPGAVTVSIGVGFLVLILAPKVKVFAGAVPILASPLLYLLGFWYLVSNGEYNNRLDELVNYDNTSATMRHQEFSFSAIELLFVALTAYGIFCFLFFLVRKLMTNAARKTRLS